jgi:hypothetical protein
MLPCKGNPADDIGLRRIVATIAHNEIRARWASLWFQYRGLQKRNLASRLPAAFNLTSAWAYEPRHPAYRVDFPDFSEIITSGTRFPKPLPTPVRLLTCTEEASVCPGLVIAWFWKPVE